MGVSGEAAYIGTGGYSHLRIIIIIIIIIII